MQRSFYILVVFSALVAGFFTLNCEQHSSRKQPVEKTETDDNKSLFFEANTTSQANKIAAIFEKSRKLRSSKWSNSENIYQLLASIKNVYYEGLNPEDYHLSTIENLSQKIIASAHPSADDVTKLELLLTDAFYLLATHMADGITDKETIDPNWYAAQPKQSIDWTKYIDSSIQAGKITETLNRLTPSHREYANLKKALDIYRQIKRQGGWLPFKTDLKKLEEGMVHPDVASLRRRLSITQGTIDPDTKNKNLFDKTLHNQMAIFQLRHGLTNDGVLGIKSIEALNIPVEMRIASIRANMERWRWLSEDLGQRYILVNIANFDLQLIENGKPIFTTEVIVGRPYRKTPVFSSIMTYLVFNPDWTVPPTILSDDVIPEIVNNYNYLSEKRMKIINLEGIEVNPATIDWDRAIQADFPYMIRQQPGTQNALGQIKFVFPNRYNVFIHDTPSRYLFTKTDRIFSSGCIRINKPLDLAQILLDGNPGWTREQINKVIKEGKPRSVHLALPVPVHILYMTVWADDNGIAYFRKDIYNRDQSLLTALKQKHTSEINPK